MDFDFSSWDELAGVGKPYGLPSGAPVVGTPFLPNELPDARLIVRMAPGADITQPSTGWPWIEVTPWVMQDSGRVIDITVGAVVESSAAFTAHCTYALKNPDGRWTARNAYSPYFPNLRKNTPTWVVIKVGHIEYTRFMGFIKGFSPTLDATGNYSIVQIEAFGRRQILDKKSTSRVSIQRSPLTRGLSTQRFTTSQRPPVRYWTFEDGADSGRASEYFGGPDIIPSQEINWASSNTGVPGSGLLPSLPSGTTIAATMPFSGDGTQWRLDFVFSIPTAPVADTLIATWTTDSTGRKWQLWYLVADNGYYLRIYNSAGTDVLNWPVGFGLYIPTTFAPFGTLMFAQIEVHADAVTPAKLDIGFRISYEEQSGKFGGMGSSVLTDSTTSMPAGHLLTFSMTVPASLDGMHFGHLAMFDYSEDYVSLGVAGAFIFVPHDMTYTIGHKGEGPSIRLTRVASEDGFDMDAAGFDRVTPKLGVQNVASTISILDETVLACGARLYDGLNGGFTAYSLRTRYSQTPVMTLSGTASDIIGDFAPKDDDFDLANTVKVSRQNGVSVIGRVYDGDTGITAIGEVGAQLSGELNLLTDEAVSDRAQMEAHIAATPGYRYETLSLNLRRRPNYAHIVLSLKFGNMVEVALPFANVMPLENERLIVEGWSERLAKYTWDIDFNCSKGDAYNVWTLTPGSEYARVGSAATSLGTNMSVPGELGTADGTFETGTSGWTPNSATFTQDATQSHSGTQSGLLTVTGAPVQAYVRASVNVNPGECYSAVMWVYSVAGYPTVSAAIDWYDKDGGYLSTSATTVAVAAATWTRVTVAAVAPAGAVRADYGPTLTGSPVAGTALWLDDVSFRGAILLVTPGVQWVDNANYASSFPMPLRVSGVKVTCTDIIGTASPQVAILADAGKPFAAGDAVQIWQTNVMGL